MGEMCIYHYFYFYLTCYLKCSYFFRWTKDHWCFWKLKKIHSSLESEGLRLVSLYWNSSILMPAGEAAYWLQGQRIKTQFILSTSRPNLVMVFVNKKFFFSLEQSSKLGFRNIQIIDLSSSNMLFSMEYWNIWKVHSIHCIVNVWFYENWKCLWLSIPNGRKIFM